MQEVLQAIEKAKKIAVLPHISIDGDCLGSAEALRLLLLQMGKTVTLYLDKKPPAYLGFLTQEYTVYASQDETFDTVIAVDCGDLGRLGTRADLAGGAFTICLDHHKTNSGFADVNFVRPNYAATAEIIYELYQAAGQPISAAAATALYTGIFTDTGRFCNSNTTSQSMRYGANLLDLGANAGKVATEIYDTQSLGRLKLMARALSGLTLHHGGRLAVIAVTRADFDACGATDDDTEGFAALSRSIAGVEVGVFIKENAEGIIKCSLRSKSYADVSAVCERFGGGGHLRASGCTFLSSVADAKEKLVAAIEDIL